MPFRPLLKNTWETYLSGFFTLVLPLNMVLRFYMTLQSHSPVLAFFFHICDASTIIILAKVLTNFGAVGSCLYLLIHNCIILPGHAYFLYGDELMYAAYFMYMYSYFGMIMVKQIPLLWIVPIWLLNVLTAPTLYGGHSWTRSIFWMIPLITTILGARLMFDLIHDMQIEKNAALRDKMIQSSKAEVFRMASHELRNPLQAMLYSVGFLSDLALEEPAGSSVQDLKYTSTLLKSIVENVLDGTVLGEPVKNIHFSDFSILEVVEGVAAIYVHAAKRKGLSLHTFVDPKLPNAMNGDPLHLSQILGNFCSNAIKVTTSGMVELRADLIVMDGTRMKLSCSDNGYGVSIQDKETIFKGLGENTQENRGFGIGLKIAQVLAQSLKGDVGYETSDKGSCFWALIPINNRTPTIADSFKMRHFDGVVVVGDVDYCRIISIYLKSMGINDVVSRSKNENQQTTDSIIIMDHIPESSTDTTTCKYIPVISPVKYGKLYQAIFTMTNEPSPSNTTRRRSASKNILVVEDEVMINKLLCKILTSAGLNVSSLFDGLEALKFLESQKVLPDIIVCDNQMPVMTGAELVYLLRKHQDMNLRKIPVIMISGNLQPSIRSELAKIKVSALQKPISPDELLNAIENVSIDSQSKTNQ